MNNLIRQEHKSNSSPLNKIDISGGYVKGFNAMLLPSEMNPSEFRLFSDFIYQMAGINLPEKKTTLLSNRIRKRLKDLNMDSYEKYYKYVKMQGEKSPELIKMIDAVTTNVTQFFRNPKQFERVVSDVLPEIIKVNEQKKSIRVLSAGCSSGEEPYTIAIVLLEELGLKSGQWKIQVDGVDISDEIISFASKGIYKEEKLECMTEKMRKKYFNPVEDGFWQVNDGLKKIVSFRRMNLKDDQFRGKYDLIFCRNVVIYFDKEMKEILYQKVYGSLFSHGFFLVGHSEGLFSDRKFKYASPGIYRKVNAHTNQGAGDEKSV